MNPHVGRIVLRFIDNPAGEQYDGMWGIYDTTPEPDNERGVAEPEIARCQDLNWARWITRALNEAIKEGHIT